jgi:hypothetical protein
MPITRGAAKQKGQRLQKAFGQALARVLGLDFGRDEMIASRESGQQGNDVRLVGKARQLFPYAVECKNTESWQVHAAIKQAKNNMEGCHRSWIAVFKRNRQPPVVILEMDEFMDIYQRALKGGWPASDKPGCVRQRKT